MKIHVLTIGKLRGPEAEMADTYAKRMGANLIVREMVAPTQKAEGAALIKAIPDKAFVVLMDERGDDLTSRALAQKIEAWEESGVRDLAFIIGGADGLTDDVRARGGFMLGLGRKTWPHKLARIMLLEQIYRAQLINAGHPYHRD